MNIVILGAGTVGTSIAKQLCETQHNVALVDSSRSVLNLAEEQLDVQTVCGSACDAITLFQAGVQSCDLCLAVTSHDEINLVGGSLAKAMGADRSIGRVFNPGYRDSSTFDYRRHFGIDRLLSLEHLTSLEIAKAIRMQSLFAVENFARGGIEVQEVAVEAESPAVGVPLQKLDLPKEVRIGLVMAGKRTFIPGASDVMHAGDHVTLIGTRDKLEDVKRLFEHRLPPKLKVMIAGGGEIGYNLALVLQRGRFNTVLLEADEERCEYLANRLDDTTVLQADVTRVAELEEARVGKSDVFVAATGRDEDNIVCGVEARELGCGRIMSVVRRPDYANVLERLGIDVAVSPREVMAQQIVGLVERGPVIGHSSIAGGVASIWELEVREGAPVTKAPLKDLQIQDGLIAAIEREDFVRVPGADDQLMPRDNAVVLVPSGKTQQVLRLFEPER